MVYGGLYPEKTRSVPDFAAYAASRFIHGCQSALLIPRIQVSDLARGMCPSSSRPWPQGRDRPARCGRLPLQDRACESARLRTRWAPPRNPFTAGVSPSAISASSLSFRKTARSRAPIRRPCASPPFPQAGYLRVRTAVRRDRTRPDLHSEISIRGQNFVRHTAALPLVGRKTEEQHRQTWCHRFLSRGRPHGHRGVAAGSLGPQRYAEHSAIMI